MPSGEKLAGAISAGGRAASGSGAAALGSTTTRGGGSGGADAGVKSHPASAPNASSAANPAPQRRSAELELFTQLLVTVQVTVWVERGHEVAWQ